jgi:uncharacterized protein
MQYRKFGKLNWKISALSLGIAGLPSLSEDDAVKLVRDAIDSGVNLLDVGWPLAVKNIEPLFAVLENALKDGYRQKIKVCAAIPVMKISGPSDFSLALANLFRWLRADRVDFLLLGTMNRFTWQRVQNLNIMKAAEKALAEKKVGHLGFFFHDQFLFLRDVIAGYDNWSLCQFQYSFMDVDHHPGYYGLKYAADNGLAVITSRPLLGGRLVKNIPKSVGEIWSAAEPERSPQEWAMRWVWNHPEISSVVCDVFSADQLKDTAALADAVRPDNFSVPEELVINKARDAYIASKPIPCTACRGCMPCPQNIDVPRIFELYNDAVMYKDLETARMISRLERHDLDICNECGKCVCAKKIPIPEWLKKARTLLVEEQKK